MSSNLTKAQLMARRAYFKKWRDMNRLKKAQYNARYYEKVSNRRRALLSEHKEFMDMINAVNNVY